MPIECTPLSGSLGAEVRGVDVTDLGDSQIAELHEAFLQHHLLVFREQNLTPAQHVEFGQRWGPLQIHPSFPTSRDTRRSYTSRTAARSAPSRRSGTRT
jgi:alpha-ketoglutarate-dependent taurine dioxygenase